MEKLYSLKYFPRKKNGLFFLHSLFSFDNFFRLLLKDGLSHEEALEFTLLNAELNGLVFQERINNRKYKVLKSKDALPPYEAARKAIFYKDMLEIVSYSSINMKRKKCLT